MAWAGATYLLGWLYLRWKRFTLPLRPLPVTLVAAALLAGILGRGAAENWTWWRHRTQDARNASAMLAGLPAHALVVGSWAPLVTLDAPARAAIIWPGLNAEDRGWPGEVTHLFLQAGPNQRRVVGAQQSATPPLHLAFAIPDHPWVDSADGGGVSPLRTAST